MYPSFRFLNTPLVVFKMCEYTTSSSILSSLANIKKSYCQLDTLFSFSFLSFQVCKVNGQLSAPYPINQGIVQGSDLGPQSTQLLILLQNFIISGREKWPTNYV